MRIIILAILISAIIAMNAQSSVHYNFAARQAILQTVWT